MSLSLKSLSKLLSITILVLIAITALISILLNNFLANSKSSIEQEISNLFKQKISIESISFLPWNFLILNNIAVLETGQKTEGRPVFIARINCRFSLFMLAAKRDIVITAINLHKSAFDYPFIEENGEEILDTLRALASEQAIKIGIKKAVLIIPRQGEITQQAILDAKLNIIPNQSLTSSGSISLEDFPSLSEQFLLNYTCRAFFTKEGLIIDSLELKSPTFQVKLWGKFEDNLLSINGSSGLNSFPDLDIHDLACVIKLDWPEIQVRNLSFSLQNMPLSLAGYIFLSDLPAFDLKLSSFPRQSAALRTGNPEAFDIMVAGNLKQNKFNGTVGVNFVRRTKSKSSLEKVEALLKDLALFNTGNDRMQLSFAQSNLTYTSGANAYNILLEDFSALMQLESEMIKFVKISSAIYDGILEGSGKLDTSRIPLNYSFDLGISGVSANNLHNLIIYCSKVYGSFSSQIHFRSDPESTLSGTLLINKGILDRIIFFEWVAGFLTIPSLNVVNFDTLSAEFVVNDRAASLENIRLESGDVNFEGYFTLYENDLVSSKLSLVFAKEFLRDSSKLRRLINYLDKGVPSVSFHFQLSGLFQAMNFKWLESDFKQTLQKLLPPRLERKIEGEIEKIIESISAQ
ncbi:hypothetical protein ACFL1D_03140 [Candidatus Omnitrophota bacterium]